MKLLKLFSTRILITSLLLIIQITWIVLFMIKLTSYSTWINASFTLLSILIILYIIRKDENAAYKIAWIILIMSLPLFGGLFYLFFGNKGLSKHMQSLLIKERLRVKEISLPDNSLLNKIGHDNSRVMGTCKYLQDKSNFLVYSNTSVLYYPLGELMYQDMLLELKKAEKYIFLEYFIIENGVMWKGILDILTEKAAMGIDVRLIYDDFGSLFLLPNNFVKQMQHKGIKCIAFNRFRPILSLVMNNRDHRKILVIDGTTAFNGGINLADEYINKKDRFGHWKDSGLKLTGDAVQSFTFMFLEMWNAFYKTKDSYEDYIITSLDLSKSDSVGFVQPFSDTPFDNETTSENVYIELLSQAKKYVYIFTPYLIIDDEMKYALTMAAKRGIDVRIVTPGIPDKKIVYRLTRSNYAPLIKSGVRIYEYTPGFIHAKSYVCDDELAVVGTINMDYRSLYLHFECGT
ncbi:MAG: cardiolipin synthase, partial [Anaerocolumna sp.]|nr:cardiolipin synthase [Anaerocolumna sp.]